MLIQRSSINFIERPFLEPLHSAFGTIPKFESIILSLESGAGTGRAEVTNTLFPDLDFPALALTLEQQIIPLLANRSVSDTESLRKLLGKWSRNPVIYALAEMAWFDLQAAEKGVPLVKVLGGEPVSQQVFTSIDEPPLDEDGYPEANKFLDQVRNFYDSGYVHLEFKVRPGWDIAVIRAVRQENPDSSFHLDFEGALGVTNYDTLFQLRDFFPFMMEQPFPADELVEDASFQGMLTCALCLDESVTSPGIVAAALKLGSARTVKINPMRAGGFEKAKEILALCREAGVDCWISSPFSTGVGARSNLAFSSLEGFSGPFEYYDLSRFFTPEHLEGLELPPALTLDEEKTLRIE